MNEKDPKNHKTFEPTIGDLEWIIKEFRKTHGEAELSVLLKEMLGTKTEEVEPLIEIKREPPKEHIFKPKIDFKEKIDFILHHKYFKRALKVIGIYLVIYFIISSPMYFERIKYTFKKTEKIVVKEQFLEQKKGADSAALEAGEVILPGSVLVIPKIKITVPIVHSEGVDEKSIQADLKKGVAKFKGTANPGEAGNAFIMGHSSGYFWDNSPYKFVFTLLDKVGQGDNVKIYHNNKKYVYQFVDKKIVEPNDVSVLAQSEEPMLTLMTCYPPGTTSKRLILRFKQVAPEYIKPKIITRDKIIEVPKSLPSSDNRGLLDRLLFFWR